MRWLLRALMILGILLVVLGGLWLAQGTGLIQIDPIACVGSCEPVEAPSLTWSLAGAGVVGGGLTAVVIGRRGPANGRWGDRDSYIAGLIGMAATAPRFTGWSAAGHRVR